MEEPIEASELVGERFNVVPLSDAREWREQIAAYQESGRKVVNTKVADFSVHDEDEVLINKGAAPCAIMITHKPHEQKVGIGHYIVGARNYEDYLSWINESVHKEDITEYIFGQSFTPNDAASYTHESRKKAVRDLMDVAGLERDQIHDFRSNEHDEQGTDNVIVDAQQKTIYFLRVHRNRL